MLLGEMYRYEMDLASIVEDAIPSTNGQTNRGQMYRQMDK